MARLHHITPYYNTFDMLACVHRRTLGVCDQPSGCYLLASVITNCNVMLQRSEQFWVSFGNRACPNMMLSTWTWREKQQKAMPTRATACLLPNLEHIERLLNPAKRPHSCLTAFARLDAMSNTPSMMPPDAADADLTTCS